MKFVALLVTLAAASLLMACEASGPTASTDTSGNGTPLGDSNVHVSGYVQSGGTVNPR